VKPDNLWQISEAVAAMEVTAAKIPEGPIRGISIDSRTVQKDDLFFAILGDQLDGHDYVAKALDAGARAAVVSRAVEGTCQSKLLIVKDTLEALNRLGMAARARTEAKIIAITGSVGKTGTKEALRLGLEKSGRTHAAVASFNNHWGVPLTLARCPENADFGIFEIGMNHAGEITPLVRMVRPHIVIITNVAPVHLEYFNSLDDIAAAKAEIFDGLEPAGTAILNRDNKYFDYLAKAALDAGAAKIIGVGEHKAAQVKLVRCKLEADSSTVYVDMMGQSLNYQIGAPGKHLVLNSLCVLAAVQQAGGDVNAAAAALKHWAAQSGRGARHFLTVKGKTAVLIDETFNANPTSMCAAFATLASAEPEGEGRKIAVLGDMLELGEISKEAHRDLLKPLLEANVDQVFAAGANMKFLWDDVPDKLRGTYAPEAHSLTENLVAAIQPGDVVMIKGSKGSKMHPLVDALLTHFR
jgi:UDP-N-acetylmuramoyl-tripeptide--D-alanyl-D-alanine ligase